LYYNYIGNSGQLLQEICQKRVTESIQNSYKLKTFFFLIFFLLFLHTVTKALDKHKLKLYSTINVQLFLHTILSVFTGNWSGDLTFGD